MSLIERVVDRVAELKGEDWRKVGNAFGIGAALGAFGMGILAKPATLFTLAYWAEVLTAAIAGGSGFSVAFIRGLLTKPAADKYIPGVTPERRRERGAEADGAGTDAGRGEAGLGGVGAAGAGEAAGASRRGGAGG